MRIAILLLSLGLIPSIAFAQAMTDEDLYIEQVRFVAEQAQKPTLSVKAAAAALRPEGGLNMSFSDGNLSAVFQMGDDNAAVFNQLGRENVALAVQYGNDNAFVLEQIGDGNVVAALVIGDNNALSVSQRGNGNTYVLDFVGRDLDHSVRQHGNGMNAVQVGRGTRPFGIEQTGNGASITIEHW